MNKKFNKNNRVEEELKPDSCTDRISTKFRIILEKCY